MKLMKRTITVSLLFVAGLSAAAQDYTWDYEQIDGDMTGCVAPSKDNSAEAVGVIKGGRYHAPNGRVFKRNSAVARTAKVVLDAQAKMARVKEVIGYSTEAMSVSYPESALSDWFIDILVRKAEQLAGKKVHIGITNFGGIRSDMPQGPVILDDVLSMFPFRNYLAYVEHSGSQIRSILEKMAASRFEVLGGVRVVAEDGKLISVEIDGEPLDDDKVYGMATISFLLNGGDGLSLAEDALYVEVYEDVLVIDPVLEHIYAETDAGRQIGYKTDGRVLIKDFKKR